jgi:hypothetical protein
VFLRSSGMTRHHCRARLCARLQVYSITSNATESALASADGYASEPVSLGENRLPKKFLLLSGRSRKKGWVLRWEGLPDYVAVSMR